MPLLLLSFRKNTIQNYKLYGQLADASKLKEAGNDDCSIKFRNPYSDNELSSSEIEKLLTNKGYKIVGAFKRARLQLSITDDNVMGVISCPQK